MRLLLYAGDAGTEVPAREQGGDLVLDRAAVLAATGWEVEDHGLCRGDVCRPARLGDDVALSALAGLLDRPLALAPATTAHDLCVAVLGEPGGTTVRAGVQAPELALRDADGDPVPITHDGAGRKKVVVAWSTWCGCRHELPAWRALADELEPQGLDLVTVALDDDSERVRHWAGKAGLRPVLDPEHRLSDVFGIVNVPATVWLDEQDRVVKPPTIAPGDDTFVEFTDVRSEGHHQALRQWLAGGGVPEVAGVTDDDTDLRAARAERRLAAWLQQAGRTDEAEEHFAAAVALAPLDFSIRRSSMRSRGQDPFGTEFFELWEEWSAAGRPGYRATT